MVIHLIIDGFPIDLATSCDELSNLEAHSHIISPLQASGQLSHELHHYELYRFRIGGADLGDGLKVKLLQVWDVR